MIAYLDHIHFYAYPLWLESRNQTLVYSGHRVLDLYPTGEMGIQPGDRLAEARSVLRGADFIEYEPARYTAYQEHWLKICAKASSRIEPISPSVAYLDLAGHADPVDVLEKVIKRIAAPCQGAVGPTKAAARLLALGSGPLWQQASIEHLSEFPTSILEAKKPTLEKMNVLGIRTLGQLSALPISTLQKHFPQEAKALYHAARGLDLEPIKALYPPGECQFQLVFDSAIECTEHLMELALYAGRDLAQQLQDRDASTHTLTAKLEGDGQIERLKRRFARPISDLVTCMAALRLLLQNRTLAQVEKITIKLTKLEKKGTAQDSLYGQSQASIRTLSEIGNNFRELYGRPVIVPGGEWDIPRRKRLLHAYGFHGAIQ